MTDNKVVYLLQDSKKPSPEQVEAQKSRAHGERIARLRAALSKNPKMPPGEAKIVAQALRGLLDRIKEQYRVRTTDVLRDAGLKCLRPSR